MTLREATEHLLNLVEGQSGRLQSNPEQGVRHFAAAGLMRCCLLLRGILVLEDAGLTHPAGILARQHWETWLVSLYALLGGDEALQTIAGDDIHWKRNLANRLDIGVDYHGDWAGATNPLNYKAIADQVMTLLVKAGEPVNTTQPTSYDVTYRTQSLFSVHANMATIGAHMVYGPEVWGVQINPTTPFPALAIQTPALHTSHLAGYVFKAFGLSTNDLDALDADLLGSRSNAVGPS